MRLEGIFRDFVTLSAGHAAAKIVAFATAVLLARILPADTLGMFAITITALGYMQAITNWGSDALGIRYVASSASSAPLIGSAVARVRVVIGAVVIAATMVIAPRLSAPPLVTAGLSACVLALMFRRDWLLLGLGMTRRVSLALAGREVVFIIAVVTLVAVYPTLQVAIWAVVLAEVSWTVLTLILSNGASRFSGLGDALSLKNLALQGLPIAIVSITVLTNNKIDVPLLGRFRAAGEVASYWGAYNLLFAAMAFAALLTRAALPEMSRQASRSLEQGAGPSFRIAVLSGIAGCVCALLMSRFASAIIGLVYGAKLAMGSEALRILAFALPANFLGAVLVGRLVAEGRQHRWTVAAVLAACLNLMLNLYLIPSYGLVGAAWATVASEWLLFTVVLVAFRRHRLHRALVLNAAVVVGCFVLGAFALLDHGRAGVLQVGAGLVVLTSAFALLATQRVPAAMRLSVPVSSQ
jgi:O-antigen/teichoic acid export membrane protein